MKISKLIQKFSVVLICLTMISLAPSKDRRREVEIDVEVDGDAIIRESRDVKIYDSHGPSRTKKDGHTEYRAGVKLRSKDSRQTDQSAQHQAILRKMHELEIQQLELGIKAREVKMFLQRTEDKSMHKDFEAELAEIDLDKQRLQIEYVRQRQRLEELKIAKSAKDSKHLANLKRINELEIHRLELKAKANEINQMMNRADGDRKIQYLEELEKIQIEYERLNIDKRRQEQLIEQSKLIEINSEDEIRDFAVFKSKIHSRTMKGDTFGSFEDENPQDFGDFGDAFDADDRHEFELKKTDLQTLKKDCPNLIKLYDMMKKELEGIDERDGEDLFEEMIDMEEGMVDLVMMKKEYPKMYQLESKSSDLEAQSEILSHEIDLAKERKKGSEKPLLKKLRQVLNEEFEAREELRKFEAEEISRELDEIQSLLKRRRENKDRIIEFRILELTQERDEMLEW